MAEPATQRQEPKAGGAGKKAEKPGLKFVSRESQELVVGFSGAIGCGMEYVTPAVTRILEEQGYEVVHIKLSKIIEGLLDKGLVKSWDPAFDAVNRWEKLQHAGNQLRNNFTTDFLSEIGIAVISSLRIQKAVQGKSGQQLDIETLVPGRVAYLIDQLKHPDEVLLLREVYGNLFYLIGVLTGSKQRQKNLGAKLAPAEVTQVMERDRKEKDGFGQHLDKTLKLADFFLRNNYQNTETIEQPLKRFFSIVHGQTAKTPTKAEAAMYAAFSAGLRSACLSRQVGASIADIHGNIVSTGCNDVPKAQGGLYSEEDAPHDHRCVNLSGGRCFNDYHKDMFSQEIERILQSKGVDSAVAKSASAEIRSESRLKDLLEFSRSVHAEMDAIVSIARQGGGSVAGGSLFTTTFPCHNCARHIVAAGISKVYYIEPYEKSLALELHSDAIVADSEEDAEKRVQFLHFEGVAPRQYQELFFAKDERKENGVAVARRPRDARKLRRQYLDGYRDFESKVVQNVVNQGFKPDEIIEISFPAAKES